MGSGSNSFLVCTGADSYRQLKILSSSTFEVTKFEGVGNLLLTILKVVYGQSLIGKTGHKCSNGII